MSIKLKKSVPFKLTVTKVCILFFISSVFVLTRLIGSASKVEGLSLNTVPYHESATYTTFLFNSSEVEKNVKYFSEQGSRVTGYQGFYTISDYIYNYFRDNLKLNVSVDEYDVLVPVDEGSFIEVNFSLQTERINAYTLWPNFIQPCSTPEGGIGGRLVYVGKGELSDFNGKDVEGSIVLMDYNSGSNWLNAAKLGAAAVVFLGTNSSNRFQSMSKFLSTPVYFPRLYVSENETNKLLMYAKNSASAMLHVNMRYKSVRAKNIIGIIEGKEYPNEVVIVSTHYDDWSPVPAIAPGADEATGLAIMLEMAKLFSENSPKRTIWFVAFGGHWQASAGARYFVENRFFSQEVEKNALKILTLINLDLSSVRPDMELLYIGHLYKYGAGGDAASIQGRYVWLSKVVGEVYQAMKDMDLSPNLLADNLKYLNWWGTQSEPYILDSEPASISGLPAFSILTKYQKSLLQLTPFDVFENVNFSNTLTQLKVSYLVANELANNEFSQVDWASIKPARLRLWTKGTSGFITLVGKVKTLNFTTGWYTALPGAIVRVGIEPTYRIYPFANIIIESSSDGSFEVYGIPPSPVLPGNVFADAWVVDNDGRILYAPDLGMYGAKAITPRVTPLSHPQEITVAVFQCGSVELFDVIDPINLRRTFIPDPTRSGELAYYQEIGTVLPFDFKTLAEPVSYGSYYIGNEPVAMVFMPPKEKFAIVFQAGQLRSRVLGVITNATEEFPEGLGLSLDEQGSRIRITRTAFVIANDIHFLINGRYTTLKEHFVSKTDAEETLSNTTLFLNLAKNYFRDKDYEKAYTFSYAALSQIALSYDKIIMPTLYDLSSTTILFFFLLIPFSVFFERVVFHLESKKRLVATFLPSGVLLLVFYFIHPALAVVSSSILTLAGIIVVVFLIIVLWMFWSEVSRKIEEEAIRRKGIHKYFVTTFAPATVFASVAIENMRKQKLRSILTFAVIIVTSIAITSFTSSSSILTVKSSTTPQESYYNGILIKDLYAAPPKQALDFGIIDLIKGVVGNKGLVFPRLWYYPPSVLPLGVSAFLEFGPKNTTIRAFLGLTPEESKLLLSQPILEGRVFSNEDYFSCILTWDQARALKVKSGDVIRVMGMDLTVVGIVNSSKIIGKDLDGLASTPLDPETLAQYRLRGGQVPAPMPLGWSSVLITPFRLVKDFGGYMPSVSVRLNNETDRYSAVEISKKLASLLDLQIYLGFDGKVMSFSKVKAFLLLGWDVITVLLVIAFLNILVSLLNLAKMKEKEMYIYSSLGLPPSGSVVIFTVEAMVYAVISVVIGYLGGFALSQLPSIIFSKNVLPPSYVFNYSSLAVALSSLAVTLLILFSSAYPILKTAKMITPSLERKWVITTRPRGDIWEIPLPIYLKTKDEALGLINYLHEYFDGEGRSTVAFSTLEIRKISYEELFIEFLTLLAPREAHIIQEVRISIKVVEVSKQFSCQMTIRRMSGSYELWRSNNYAFIDAIRKQILVWSGLSSAERKKYINQSSVGR